MPAIAAMSVAKTQANADKAIAKTNADAQIKMTEISANTQKEANQIAKDVALTQSDTAREVAEMNNGAVTDRLQLQLAELRSARTEAAAAEKERRALDESYNQQRIALAEKQSAQNLDLAKETLAAQLSEAGLRQSFSNSTNSGDRLQTTTVAAAAGTNSTRLANGLGNVAATGAAVAKGTNLGQAAGSTRTSNAERLNLGGTNTSDRSLASTSSSSATGVSTGLSLPRTSRGVNGSGSETSELKADFAMDMVADKKVIEKCKADGAKTTQQIEACAKKATPGRGLRTRERLTKKETLASNSPSGRGLAGRLTTAMNLGIVGSTPANLQTSDSSKQGSLAFREDAAPKEGSSFGAFVSKRGVATQDFVSYRAQSAGTPNRDRAKAEPAISGGHAPQKTGRGIRGLID